ncbi:hypothetical protein [Haloimpatiens lingqiaonensis]|uniref:hypothetical protein n=1 Tax=Haloimpatiens lingqiaonensis TaxID=1380675 RepID=UPI0010FF2F85|nr:hypothetical protein [Haloimpatiens lingqiaonensis]
MKKFLKWVMVIIILVVFSFNISKYVNNNRIDIKFSDQNLNYSLFFKGLDGARDFCVSKEEYYIAYKDKIQVIKKNGDSYYLFKNKNLNITSLELYEDKLYYSSGKTVCEYSIKNNISKVLIDNLPNFGDYSNSKIKISGNYLYVSIGSATNSGVVGEDNTWLKEHPYNCDILPKTSIVKGKNFGKEKTGAFVPYGTSNINGQIIPGHFPGNGSMVIYNLKTGNLENFAWGIRNIKGLDFNSENKLIAIIGGMEERGLRPVKGDVDYIYIIKKGMWYGWPDYSGGDPINSPRFKGKNGEKIGFLLDKHPSTNPPAPLYQHETLNTLGDIAVDKKGVLGYKDAIYFYDTKEMKICNLNKNLVLKDMIFINGSEKIALKFSEAGLNILDRKRGALWNVSINLEEPKNNYRFLYFYLIIVSIGIIGVIIYTKVKKIMCKDK